MARRRKVSPVPFYQWIQAFSLAQKLISDAYAAITAREPPTLPIFGAVFRIVLNKVLLPKFREELAKRPGVESPEEMKRILAEVLDKITEDEIKAAIVEGRYVPPGKGDEYAREIAKYVRLLKEYFTGRLATPTA